MFLAYNVISFLHQYQEYKEEDTNALWFLLNMFYPRVQGSPSSLSFIVIEGSFPGFFELTSAFIRAHYCEKHVAIFQECYSQVAPQHLQRNLAISNYSSEDVSFPECQHSFATVEGIKIHSSMVAAADFLKIAILY